MSTQLKDFQGNVITPSTGTVSSIQASQVQVASGIGLNSSNVQAALSELNGKIGTTSTTSASQISVSSGIGLSSSNVQAALSELNDKITNSSGAQSDYVFDMAIGSKDESCLVDDVNNGYVGSVSLSGGRPPRSINQEIVVIAHDDLPESDYVGTRKIYNKYNFKTTYNYILKPFTSTDDKNKAVTNIKRMIADGNEIGLHAILGSSFFWRNLMYDVTPEGGATFAPSLSEMKTVVNNGKNVFDITIDENSTFTTVKHSGNSSIASVKLANATTEQWFKAVSYYTVYACTDVIVGLDLNDTSVSKTYLGWLEYWYNQLIDNTLGYSTYSGTISERFAQDYSGTYPDATHILSGDLDSYGVFTKGLFKGCHSCCNYEVLDRIISIAEAFCRRFFGLPYFTNMAYHGVKFAELFWISNSALYNDRGCTVIATGHTPVYVSLKKRKMNLFDIARSHGISMIKRNYPNDHARVDGEVGLYKGQRHIRGTFFNDIESKYHINSYLSLLGTSASSTGMNDGISYSTLMQSMPSDYNQWAKFAYENAGNDISGNGTLYMLKQYKNAIEAIRKSLGTGKIAFLGVDTIVKSPSIMGAIELVCQYCYRHNIRITTANEGMEIANNPRIIDNAFPNPSFYQSLIDDFGGSSTSEDAYVPDGFYREGIGTVRVAVNDGQSVMTLTAPSQDTRVTTRIYGLSSGKYKFTAMVRSTNQSACIEIGHKRNKNKSEASPLLLTQLSAGNEYEKLEYEFIIPEPHKNAPDGTYANTVCNGYEDNFAYISIAIKAELGCATSIYNPRVEKCNY